MILWFFDLSLSRGPEAKPSRVLNLYSSDNSSTPW
jgi:hypothetical protein